MKKIFVFIALFFAFAASSSAQEIIQDRQETLKARVVEVVSEKTENIPGTETPHLVQTLKLELLEGADKGKVIETLNDYLRFEAGDVVYLSHTIPWEGGKELYLVSEPYRLPSLIFLGALFVLLTIIFGGKQGVRGLIALAGSFYFIGFILLPQIMDGKSPVLVSIFVSSLIVVIGSYVTHGFNKTTSAAVIGMIVTILAIGFFAHWSIGQTMLSGMSEDEALYLNFNSQGTLDLAGLLLGGMLIGLLGVMYDAAIGQSISVEELHRVAPHMPRAVIYARAIRIGREHIGALVNTLAIAYVGASLPLLLLFYSSALEPASVIANREIFATEIVRSLVGSIGLILTVPITTLISVWMLVKKSDTYVSTDDILKEKEALDHAGHHH